MARPAGGRTHCLVEFRGPWGRSLRGSVDGSSLPQTGPGVGHRGGVLPMTGTTQERLQGLVAQHWVPWGQLSSVLQETTHESSSEELSSGHMACPVQGTGRWVGWGPLDHFSGAPRMGTQHPSVPVLERKSICHSMTCPGPGQQVGLRPRGPRTVPPTISCPTVGDSGLDPLDPPALGSPGSALPCPSSALLLRSWCHPGACQGCTWKTGRSGGPS